MKFDLKIIACKLKRNVVRINITDQTRTLLSARLLTTDMRQFSNSAVYVGCPDDISAMQKSGLPFNLICVGKTNLCDSLDLSHHNIMIIEGDNTVDVHNEIQGIFDFYNEIDAELIDEIVCERDLQSILDKCTRFFDNPVYIFDSAYRMIAYSSDFTDPEWTGANATGYLKPEVINLLKTQDMLGQDAQLVKANSIPPFLSVSIFDTEGKIGVVGVRQVNSDIFENQLSLLQHVAEVLTGAVQKEHYSRYVKANQMSRFMLDILNGTSYDINFIIHYLSNLGWKIDDEYYVFKIIPDPKDIEGGSVKFSGELIKNMFAGSILLELGDVLALVVNTQFCRDGLDEAFISLNDFLSRRNFICGISSLFRNFSWLYEQYGLAQAAIEVGRLMDPDNKLFRYNSYVMPHMISMCDLMFNVNTICHREAIKLHEYDKVNSNNYFYCLYIYLLNERSLLTTSKKLNIHRSTLIYRLNKISEIIHIDLTDQETRMHMVYSYEILHFLDCLKGSSNQSSTTPPAK